MASNTKKKGAKKAKTPHTINLTKDELSLAKKLFAIRHPHIDFCLEGYVREKIHEESTDCGLKLSSFPASYASVTNGIARLNSNITAFLTAVNTSIRHVVREEQQNIETQKVVAVAETKAPDQMIDKALMALDQINL